MNQRLLDYRPLPDRFYQRPADTVAPELLGKWLIRRLGTQLLGGRILEVEAYLPSGDSACHAARGRTRRNASMFGPAGTAYVYAIHARHCLNVVTDQTDVPSAVLIRAIEPTEGIETMRRLRGRERPLEISRGPGRLCEALDIDRALDGATLTCPDGQLWIAADDAAAADDDDAADQTADGIDGRIEVSPRIGVTSAQSLRLRYFIAGNRFVSGPRKHR